MNLYIKNHSFHYELENLVRLFFPNEKIVVVKDNEESSSDLKEIEKELTEPYILTEVSERIYVKVKVGEFEKESKAQLFDEVENERMMCELLYKILCEFTSVTPPWGMITGVRPVKLYRKLKEADGVESADNYFLNKLFVSEEKLNLAKTTEIIEKKILDLSTDKSFSLYISIPFCPTRCYYCSFVQSSVEKSKHLIEPYVNLLCDEIKQKAKIANDLGLKLETVYMGGGTPTTLSAEQLNKVLSTVNQYFDTSSLREFTVEAGRPDTITEDKLISILENKVDRISINPQTLNDDVLKKIGRQHTAQETIEAYNLARSLGFDNINMDLIAGLPTDTYQSFVNTLDSICKLNPNCITIHTLSMKRSSTLTKDGTVINKDDAVETAKMLQYANTKLTANEYQPYYLYRQSRMVGNLENTGWSKIHKESLYNIFIMDETHTILGCGAGAVTKLKSVKYDYLKRIFNFKYPYEYIDRFQEMLSRMDEVYTFYQKYL